MQKYTIRAVHYIGLLFMSREKRFCRSSVHVSWVSCQQAWSYPVCFRFSFVTVDQGVVFDSFFFFTISIVRDSCINLLNFGIQQLWKFITRSTNEEQLFFLNRCKKMRVRVFWYIFLYEQSRRNYFSHDDDILLWVKSLEFFPFVGNWRVLFF